MFFVERVNKAHFFRCTADEIIMVVQVVVSEQTQCNTSTQCVTERVAWNKSVSAELLG